MTTRTTAQRRFRSLPREVAQGKLLLGKYIAHAAKQVGFGAKSSPTEKAEYVIDQNDESHTLVIGPMGSGKGVSSIMPTVLTSPSSLICVDVKGEITQVAARRRREMGQAVYVLDPFHLVRSEPDTLNPYDLLTVPGTDFAVEDLIYMCANSLGFGDRSMSQDVFWDNKARDLIAAGVAVVLATEPPERRNWITVRNLFMQDDVVFGLATIMDKFGKQLPPLAAGTLANFLSTEDKCRSGILSTATQYFGFCWHSGVEESLRRTSFDLAALREGQPMTIFMVLPPTRLASHGRLLRLWVDTLLQLLLTRTQRPKLPTLLVLDEAAQLGTLDSLRTALTLMRGYGLRTMTYWQDLAQLQKLYPDYPTLLNNCANLLLLQANTFLAAQSMAQLTGTTFSPEEMLGLAPEEAILIRKGKSERIQKLNYLTDPLFAGMADPNPFYNLGVADATGSAVQDRCVIRQ